MDTAGAVLGGLAGLVVIIAGLGHPTHEQGYSEKDKTVAVLAGAGVVGAGVTLAFSADYGFSAAKECRHLQEAQLSCASGVEEACRTLQERKPQ